MLVCAFTAFSSWAQTKVGGTIRDEYGEPIAFANIIFPGSTTGTTSDENGAFYLESDQVFRKLNVSFIGYEPQTLELTSRISLGLNVVLRESAQALEEVVVYTGKQSKKNNPAVDILRKIWARKRTNGLAGFEQYEYDKYEKVEFDLNNIDSSMMKSRVFRGMEFVFDDMDTSRITGKTYLPFFLNETFERVYGNNQTEEVRVDRLGDRNAGFRGNQAITAFVEDLYNDYDIYDNYLKFFDKSFTSPLSRTGIATYNYVLTDSTFIDNKWCYNIVFYPRRKNELTFRGDFWVADTTFAVKKIGMSVTRSANINWLKDVYIEQEYRLVNDSVFLIDRDYMMTDFSLRKKEDSRGIYGHRTTVYDNYVFDRKRSDAFYQVKTDPYAPQVLNRDSVFWRNARLEELSEDESGIFKMLDTLKTVPKFNTIYNVISILASGYVEIDKWNLDIGDVYSTFGNNQAEGFRIRAGARTYFGQNDTWRLQGYVAYGFRDERFKHGLSAKFLLDRQLRLIMGLGTRTDVEQLGITLTPTTDVLGRSSASSAVLTVGNNDRLTNITLSRAYLQIEPVHNLQLSVGATRRSLRSALPEAFSLDYLDPGSPTGISSSVQQLDLTTSLTYTPGRRTIGYGVEPRQISDNFRRIFVLYSNGVSGLFGSDFDYQRIQFSYTQPWQLGGLGRLLTTVEAGKTYGEVPLALLSVIPGNQTLFTIYNTFPNLDFYEFVTDTYATGHFEHTFNGRIFARVPLLRKLNLRENLGFRVAWGSLSDANRALSAPSGIPLLAPTDRLYYEYSVGVGNILKVLRLDAHFRGNYLDNPNARRFSLTGSFGFSF